MSFSVYNRKKKVLAYGVEHQIEEHPRGILVYGHIHYWVDVNLQMGAEWRNCGDIPGFVEVVYDSPIRIAEISAHDKNKLWRAMEREIEKCRAGYRATMPMEPKV